MQLTPATLVDVSPPDLDRFAARFASRQAAGGQDIGADFESLFVSLMLKEMRQTVSDDGLFEGDASDTYGGLFDMFLGQHIAQGGGLGLGRLLNAQLTKEGSL